MKRSSKKDYENESMKVSSEIVQGDLSSSKKILMLQLMYLLHEESSLQIDAFYLQEFIIVRLSGTS